MKQKIRLWLIKKLKATPNEMNVKVPTITRTRNVNPISVTLRKNPHGNVSLELAKKQALVMMENEIMKYIAITDNPLDIDHIKATITVVE